LITLADSDDPGADELHELASTLRLNAAEAARDHVCARCLRALPMYGGAPPEYPAVCPECSATAIGLVNGLDGVEVDVERETIH
jgi:hypothetical protein